jgi:hypothetical protein
MKTTKVFTTAVFGQLSTRQALIRKGKFFQFRQNQGRIREVGLDALFGAERARAGRLPECLFGKQNPGVLPSRKVIG